MDVIKNEKRREPVFQMLSSLFSSSEVYTSFHKSENIWKGPGDIKLCQRNKEFWQKRPVLELNSRNSEALPFFLEGWGRKNVPDPLGWGTFLRHAGVCPLELAKSTDTVDFNTGLLLCQTYRLPSNGWWIIGIFSFSRTPEGDYIHQPSYTCKIDYNSIQASLANFEVHTPLQPAPQPEKFHARWKGRKGSKKVPDVGWDSTLPASVSKKELTKIRGKTLAII